MSKWSDEETNEPLLADRPRIKLTIRQRTRVLKQWPAK
jgi:hypothetical protein